MILKGEMKMKKKILHLLGFLIVCGIVMSACASTPTTAETPASEENDASSAVDASEEVSEEESEEPVKITYYSTSAEVNSMFEEMFAEYHELFPNVTVELIPVGVGEGQQEKLQSLYASGNAPTFMNLDPSNVLEYKEYLLPLTLETAPWLSYLNEGTIEAGTFDGETFGIPWTTQGYGINYNKRIVDEVYGGTFDPATINTRNALQEFLEKIETAGYPAFMFHGVNWSLGSHYLGLTYAVHGPSTADGTNYFESLISGEANLIDDEIFNGYMDTFDLLTQYNYRKDDPLVGDYNADVQAFAEGKVATFFMGDWIWTVMSDLENKDTDFGFIPLPWSNDPDDYGNTQIAVSMPKLQAIDASQNTPEQQQAALDMLEWMLTSPEGQEYLIGQGFSMPYTNIREAEYNSMTTSVQKYSAEGKTINIGSFVYLTGDAWTKTGDLMLQYLDGVIDRAGLAEAVDEYWQSLE